jgi:predicted nucleic acid-binding Zn ribbon protein
MAKRPAKPRIAAAKPSAAARAARQDGASPQMSQLIGDIERRRGEQRYVPGAGPKRVGQILAQSLARSGFAQQTVAAEIVEAWRAIVDPKLLRHTRVGRVRRGVLEVVVANSGILQELAFFQAKLAAQLAERLPAHKIKAIRFRTGSVDD